MHASDKMAGRILRWVRRDLNPANSGDINTRAYHITEKERLPLEFNDKRRGKLVVVAHCVLNQNSRVLG